MVASYKNVNLRAKAINITMNEVERVTIWRDFHLQFSENFLAKFPTNQKFKKLLQIFVDIVKSMPFQGDADNADQVLGYYKNLQSECQQIVGKIGELNLEKDEHKLVMDTLVKLEDERAAYRLIGGVLVKRTVGKC